MCLCLLAVRYIKVELGLGHFPVVYPSVASTPPGIKANLLKGPKALAIIQTCVMLLFLTHIASAPVDLSVPGSFPGGVWTILP